MPDLTQPPSRMKRRRALLKVAWAQGAAVAVLAVALTLSFINGAAPPVLGVICVALILLVGGQLGWTAQQLRRLSRR